MGEQTFAHFQQAIVNAMEKRTLDTEKGKSACNHSDDDPPDPSEAAPTCNEDTVKQNVQSVDDTSMHPTGEQVQLLRS